MICWVFEKLFDQVVFHLWAREWHFMKYYCLKIGFRIYFFQKKKENESQARKLHWVVLHMLLSAFDSNSFQKSSFSLSSTILKPFTFTITFSFHSSVDGKQMKWFKRTFYSFSFVNSWRFLCYKPNSAQRINSITYVTAIICPTTQHRNAIFIKHLTHFFFPFL